MNMNFFLMPCKNFRVRKLFSTFMDLYNQNFLTSHKYIRLKTFAIVFPYRIVLPLNLTRTYNVSHNEIENGVYYRMKYEI